MKYSKLKKRYLSFKERRLTRPLFFLRSRKNFRISLQLETEIDLPTTNGLFHSCLIEDSRNLEKEHLLIWKGELDRFPLLQEAILVRIHSECFTGEVLSSKRCDCREQLCLSLSKIEDLGVGFVIYLRQEGRGIGLRNKMRAYSLQQSQNLDTIEANTALGLEDDLREYSVAVAILQKMGIRKVRLMTNNPLKVQALESAGIEVIRVALEVDTNCYNAKYLQTKKEKNGHFLDSNS